MSAFDERYYPLKRAFPARSAKYRRSGALTAHTVSFPGKELICKKLQFSSVFPSLTGKRLIFVSDWHWHNSARNRKIVQEFKEIMQEIKPDILLLGGDLCDDAEYLDSLPELLDETAAIAPEILAVKGNWETGKRWLPDDFFNRMYSKYNIRILENETVTLGELRFTGVPDISSLDFVNLPPPENDGKAVNILLAHSPDAVMALDKNGFTDHFAYAFCGHTHGGQIRLPLLGAIYCPGFYRCKFDRGIFERENSQFKMIVSSGIGEHSGSRRFLCPPEFIFAEFAE